MSKQLLVSSAIQAVLMNSFFLNEIRNGHWKDQRPSTHVAAWDDVEIKVSETNQVGPVGFVSLRNYDFLNPEFTAKYEARIVELAQTVKPGVKFKTLKKELIELARIIGGRMTDKSVEPARLYRGNNRKDFDVIRSVKRQKVLTAASAKAAVTAATAAVKRTAVKKPKVVSTDTNVTTTVTSSGATVRHVPVQASVKTERTA